MYLETSTDSTSRPAERRRNPRLRAPSIMYVQLGSDNGGIVVNLGIDGVGFQAARKLTAERNSTLNLRLHGSGLNVDLLGELVWLGGTQKEAGISFKSLSTDVQQNIADWIAREALFFETAGLEDCSRPTPMPTMSAIPATDEDLVPHSLSAALAMSQAMSANPTSSAGADTNESSLRTPLDSAAEIPGATLQPEIVSPIEHGNVPSNDLDVAPQKPNADSSAWPKLRQVEQPLHHDALFEPPPIELPYQFPAGYSSPAVPSVEPMSNVRVELPRASAQPPRKNESFKIEKIAPIPRNRVSEWSDRWLEAIAVAKQVPPVLLAAWKRVNPQHKLLLAGTAAVCVLVIVLIFTLSVAHTESSTGVSETSSQTGPLQAPGAPRATVRPRSHQQPTSLLTSLGKILFGYEPKIRTEIGDSQVGVQVWTLKTSGYYYCADSPFYNSVQSGTFMTQGDALQSGYRPKLGQFCD